MMITACFLTGQSPTQTHLSLTLATRCGRHEVPRVCELVEHERSYRSFVSLYSQRARCTLPEPDPSRARWCQVGASLPPDAGSGPRAKERRQAEARQSSTFCSGIPIYDFSAYDWLKPYGLLRRHKRARHVNPVRLPDRFTPAPLSQQHQGGARAVLCETSKPRLLPSGTYGAMGYRSLFHTLLASVKVL
jgi:hypothetical protein